jgi:pimeloyl-ACP methyl ester carboxylesterase
MTTVAGSKVRANGLTFHFTMAGEGKPILLVHGWMGTSYHWRKVVPLLAVRHRVVAIDARGYGDSGRLTHGHSLPP